MAGTTKARRLCSGRRLTTTKTWRNCCANTAALNKLFFISNNSQRASPKQGKILPDHLILHFAVNPPDTTQIYFPFLNHA
jgi:hypothetical protein